MMTESAKETVFGTIMAFTSAVGYCLVSIYLDSLATAEWGFFLTIFFLVFFAWGLANMLMAADRKTNGLISLVLAIVAAILCVTMAFGRYRGPIWPIGTYSGFGFLHYARIYSWRKRGESKSDDLDGGR
jgi:hypothetical protein